MCPDIAIIDSGINPDHVHVQEVIGGHSLIMDSNGEVKKKIDFSDEIGHGTAIAGIIRKHAPFAGLYGIKIFQKELYASGQILMESLKWAIKNNFKIIHLSLGIESEKYKKKLQALCRDAHDRGIVIVSAARSSEDQLLPASFETVIGVYWNRDCSEEKLIYHPGKVINFGAHGWPRPIPGMPQKYNFRGNSFAVAHVTAKVAQILALSPDTNIAFVIKELLKRSGAEISCAPS